MHIIKEANTSSRIEGTQTNIDDVLMDEEDVLPEKRNVAEYDTRPSTGTS